MIKRLGLLLALAVVFTASSSVSAFGAVRWEVSSVSNTSVPPGGSVEFVVTAINLGDSATDGSDVTFTAVFPSGLTPVSASGSDTGCGIAAQVVTCVGPASVAVNRPMTVNLVADVGGGVSGVQSVLFDVSGGGAAGTVESADTVLVSPDELPFGVDAFDASALDTAGGPVTQAGGHPDVLTTSIDFNIHTDPVVGPRYPVEDVKDVTVDLPAGLVGSVAGLGECTIPELGNGTGITNPLPLCPPTSQVGIMYYRVDLGTPDFVAVYNMKPPPGVPARFGINVSGTIVVLDASLVRSGGYHLRVRASDVPQGLAIDGNSFIFWGVPADRSHDSQRSCAGQGLPSVGGPSCSSGADLKTFFRNPTSCTGDTGLPLTVQLNSWQTPSVVKQTSIRTHDPVGYPFPPAVWGPEQGTTGCETVPFDPKLVAQPLEGAKAGSAAAFSFDLTIPQDDTPGSTAQSDLKKAVVVLPAGVRINPSSATGLEACSPDQIGLENTNPSACPDASKLGTVVIDTPLIDEQVTGNIYLATPFANPFKSLVAVYIVASARGVVIKLPGQVSLDAKTGQITTTFDDNPQLPFDRLHVEFFGGPHTPLALSDECGTHTTQSTFTGWNARVVQEKNSFTINEGCEPQGFSPTLNAGVDHPFPGAHSPFALQVKRSDTDQEISTLDTTLPPGLTAVLKGIPPCPESALAAFPNPPVEGQGAVELASPHCPAASQVGKVIVGAGAGTNPFYVDTGKAYLAGPYRGAPLSLAFVTPAVAGPFDLGNVLVRAAAHVNPVTAQVTAKADPLPQVLQGIPLDIRDIRVNMDRPNFILNPTSCDEMSVDASLTSIQGTPASARDRFQLAECSRLAFKPKLTLRLKGGTTRGKHPALTAILKPRRGDANISKVSVALPKSEFLDQAHIRTICTRAQFAASECPRGAIYGEATVTTPLFDQKLSGPVYLRSSRNLLPDLVPDLRGPADLPIRIESAGRVDEVKGGIRNTFDFVPDAPFTKLVMRLKGGNKGLLQNSRNICRQAFRATVKMDAHNGRIHDFKPVLRANCGKKSKRPKR